MDEELKDNDLNEMGASADHDHELDEEDDELDPIAEGEILEDEEDDEPDMPLGEELDAE